MAKLSKLVLNEKPILVVPLLLRHSAIIALFSTCCKCSFVSQILSIPYHTLLLLFSRLPQNVVTFLYLFFDDLGTVLSTRIQKTELIMTIQSAVQLPLLYVYVL